MSSLAERRLEAACERLRALGDGRRTKSYKAALAVGGRLHWEGSPSRSECEDRLTDAAGGQVYRNHVRRGLAHGARKPLEEPRRAATDGGDSEALIHIRPRKDDRHNDIAEVPRRADRRRTWDQLKPIELGGEIEAYLIGRGINPDTVRALDLARELPRGAKHPGMWCDKVPWAESGNRLVFPQWDANGVLVNMMGRPVERRDEQKALGLGGVTGGAHIQACPTGRALLEGRAWAIEAVKRRGVVVPEGEFDVATWAQRGADSPVTLGGKHWSQEHADRIPDGTEVFLRPDNDEYGRALAHEIATTLYGRCNVYAPPLPLWGDDDDNDRHNAGTLPAHPRDDSAPYFLSRNGVLVPCVVPLPVDEARAHLGAKLARLSQPHDGEPRTVVVNADTGAGKTYRQVRETILALISGLIVRWAAPTDRFIRETLDEFRDAAGELRLGGKITNKEHADLLETFANCVDVGRNTQSCNYYDYGILPASRATPTGGGVACGGCPLRDDCIKAPNGYLRRQMARQNGRPYDFTITTHAMEALQGEDAPPVDLLIIDEDPSGALLTEERFSASHLAQWFNAGDLGDLSEDAKNRLLALIVDSETREKSAPLPPDTLEGADLGETDNAAADALKLIRGDSEIANRDTWASIQKAPPWRALEALRYSARRRFEGCRVERGEVVVQRRQAFRRPAQTTVVLDATSTPQRAAALFGNAVEFIAVRCTERKLTVTHLTDWTPSKYNMRPEFADTWRRFNEVAEAKVDAKTLVILTKPIVGLLRAMGEDAPPWFQRASDARNVLYFGQAGSAGSNLYRDCERVLVVPFFVPRAAIDSRAAVLANIADTELKPDDDTWTSQARFEIETSRIIQAVGRARSMVEVIIMGGERTFGFTPDKSVHVDLYAWRECLGTFCPAACLDEYTRLQVAMRGGASVLSVKSLAGVSQGTSGSGIYIWGFPKWGETPSEQRLNNALKDLHDGSTVNWGKRAGCGVISVTTSAGVRRIAYTAEHGEPTPDRSRALLLISEPGLKWFRLPEDEEETRRELVDPIAEYDAGIIALARAGETLSVRNLARVSGVSVPSTGRACKRHRAEMNERYARAVEAAKVPKREWKPPMVRQWVDMRTRAPRWFRLRDRVPPKWHTFLQEHGYLIGRVPTSRGAPPQWARPSVAIGFREMPTAPP